VKVHEAILEVMRAIPAVPKDDRNVTQNFSFRGVDAVMNAVGPKLREHGVLVLPQVQEHHAEGVVVGRNATQMRSVVLLVRYVFIGPEGDKLEVEVPGEAMDAGDKAYSKAMSVALRTALLQALSLPTDEKDPDEDTYERASSQTAAPSRAATPASTPAKTSPPKPPKTEADIARDDLLAKIKALKLNPPDVAKLYLADNGVELQAETDATKIASFTERLEPKK
jgi:hypothetical protein